MKRFHALALISVLTVTGGAAMAATGALSPFTPKVLPVLVQVNAEGKVTSLSPAIELPPSFKRLLAKNVGEMITKPAYDNGRPVSSQFVMNLALTTTPRDEGDYDAQFAYISTAPVPLGTWHWVNLEDRRFALAPNNSSGRRMFFDGGQRAYEPMNTGNVQRSFSPPASSAPPSTPAPSTAHGH
ncbi:hypothetical protein [Dyella silvatica]|uniref:hypothetical protein n=1 Tax=Dyella silvatica TaxID=2992128 RepID=UPI002259740F|nr:hypothetical protein [Dyella silvatica]